MSDPSRENWPSVSVVMPVLNAASTLQASVSAILSQHYPGVLEICLAVGPSRDGTEAVAEELARIDERIRVVSNPSGRTPSALNTAIAATTGEIVVRVDAHSRLSEGYITRAVEVLDETHAVNVGGIQSARGHSPFSGAVARAMTSRAGTGGGSLHLGGEAGPVDTVYLGVFRRAAGDGVGWFDERLVRNQDYELNIRLRAAGGTVWFDPMLSVEYSPRSSLGRLARQYLEYGWWKAKVFRLHPGSLRARQAAPALFTLMMIASVVVSPVWPVALILPTGYAVIVAMVALTTRGLAVRERLWLAVVYPTMHLSWGAGFLASVARGLRTSR